ncbi:hypothetical protein FY034_17810 (plasmid) [Trichlorobacter lovleyi]|uniref:hypothetical protein n=1 Tax=Trichlorobacter lovleyi TaxID=313985 RepID=UPI00223F49B0|nr:hypothetical protein [Trichlorobacter lovleyi]QOX80878.1 hypothetical protein FY034_17810 [Trichlorobacter lovleyi]
MSASRSAAGNSEGRGKRQKPSKTDNKTLLSQTEAWLKKPSPVGLEQIASLGDEMRLVLIDVIESSVKGAQELLEVADIPQQQAELNERNSALDSVKKTVSGGTPRDWSREEWHWVCDAMKKYSNALRRFAPGKSGHVKQFDNLLVWLCGGHADEYIRSMVGMVEKHMRQRNRLRAICATAKDSYQKTENRLLTGKTEKKIELAQREQSVVLLAEADGTKLIAALLANSDQLCRALERRMARDMPIKDVMSARELLNARGGVAAALAEVNRKMEQLLGFGHREIVGECPGYKRDASGGAV